MYDKQIMDLAFEAMRCHPEALEEFYQALDADVAEKAVSALSSLTQQAARTVAYLRARLFGQEADVAHTLSVMRLERVRQTMGFTDP